MSFLNSISARKAMTSLRRFLVLGVGAWLLASCEQKELCYDHNHASNVRISFCWDEYPEANPSSMMTCLFPRDSTQRMLRREHIGKDGGACQALVGVGYSALGFNSDTRNTTFHVQESTSTVAAHSKDASMIERIGIPASQLPRAEGTEGERMTMEADSLYSASSEKDILATLEQHDRGDTIRLTLFPKRRFATYRVKILSIDNKENMSSSVAASVSGLSGGIDLSTGERMEGKVTVPFAMEAADSTSLEGQLRCFGAAKGEEQSHRLVVYNVLRDGTKWCYVWDVTKQVMEAPDPYEVEIVIDKLPIPSKIGDNSGLLPDVSPWHVVEIPVKM